MLQNRVCDGICKYGARRLRVQRWNRKRTRRSHIDTFRCDQRQGHTFMSTWLRSKRTCTEIWDPTMHFTEDNSSTTQSKIGCATRRPVELGELVNAQSSHTQHPRGFR